LRLENTRALEQSSRRDASKNIAESGIHLDGAIRPSESIAHLHLPGIRLK
jgi:hypothetical protein